jgi:hypothetical protein
MAVTPRLAFSLALAGAVASFCVTASAKCVGGGAIKGNFGVTINGPLTSDTDSELYVGMLTSDGKCGLTGSLTGGTFGQPSTTQGVTGTYTVPSDKQGSLSLLLPGASSATTFAIGLAADGKAAEIDGLATNGTAVATIQATAVGTKTYSLASLSGHYIGICTGASNGGSGGFGTELAYSTYDGAGQFSADAVGNNNGTPFSVSVTGSYTVAADGAVSEQDASPYANFSVAAELVNNGTEIRSILIQAGNGGGPYRTCLGKKQS